MLEKYKTVYEGGEGEIVEKKSRFIATVRPVKTEEEALAFIEEMKKKYWDARHNCSAFVIGDRQEISRYILFSSLMAPDLFLRSDSVLYHYDSSIIMYTLLFSVSKYYHEINIKCNTQRNQYFHFFLYYDTFI